MMKEEGRNALDTEQLGHDVMLHFCKAELRAFAADVDRFNWLINS